MFAGMKNIVGRRIMEARHSRGRKVTQEQLAAKLQTLGINIDRTAISKIEQGRRPVTDKEIVAICQALGIKVAELFEDT